MPKNEDKNLAVMALDNVNQARKFHRSFPQYSVTPLAKLDGMAGTAWTRRLICGKYVKTIVLD